MLSNIYVPTRIVAGARSLAIGRLAREPGMSRVHVVSDPVISAQGFQDDALAEAGIATARFDDDPTTATDTTLIACLSLSRNGTPSSIVKTIVLGHLNDFIPLRRGK